jgi:hypothetical protein
LRDAFDDMFTVRRLGVVGTLATRFVTTNCIESMNSIDGCTSGRVSKGKDGTMKKRWTSAGMLEAERLFRRVSGSQGMDKLVDALRRETTPAVVTLEECDQAAT